MEYLPRAKSIYMWLTWGVLQTNFPLNQSQYLTLSCLKQTSLIFVS
jgi:hypothetical protein